MLWLALRSTRLRITITINSILHRITEIIIQAINIKIGTKVSRVGNFALFL